MSVYRYDYTITFDFSPLSFAMAKPVPKPSWLSFYHPLSSQVWAAVIASTMVVCFTLVMVSICLTCNILTLSMVLLLVMESLYSSALMKRLHPVHQQGGVAQRCRGIHGLCGTICF